jgi:adenosylcobinamide-phosphate synthase
VSRACIPPGYHHGMSFFAIFFALLLEQARPLSPGNAVHRLATAWRRRIRRSLDAGQAEHGWMAWSVAALVPVLLVALVHWLLLPFSDLLVFVWTVAVLYVTLGFRQFSHHFTAIRQALEAGDESQALTELARWRGVAPEPLARQELLRQVIEHSALEAHRHVFGVLLAYSVFAVLGLGPAGAVLYRMGESLARRWQPRLEDAPSEAAQKAAAQAWLWIDHAPARATALAFAVVGNFEESIAAWRSDAARFGNPNDGIVLAATAGAINVRLGGQGMGENPAQSAGWAELREPQPAHLASLVGLVWRSVVLWLLLLLLTTMAHSVG